MSNRMTEAQATAESLPLEGCKRCGTCCLKGGPALHAPDKPAVSSGRIPARDLFTIRAGEPSLDNVRGCILPAPTDIIKLKSRGPSQGCLYYNRAASRCMLYRDRPLECRLLSCWDTATIESGYQKDRLTRKDLIGGVAGLWKLVSDHQEHCSYPLLGELADDFKKKRDIKTAQKLLGLVGDDTLLRRRVLESGRVREDMLLFLFGRPLRQTIGMFDLQLTGGDVRVNETAAEATVAEQCGFGIG